MQTAKTIQMFCGAAVLATCWAAPAMPAFAADEKGDHERMGDRHGGNHEHKGGHDHQCTCGKSHGDDEDEDEGMHGHHGMMPRAWRKHGSRIAEIRYSPASLSAAGANGNQFVTLGGGMQVAGDRVFSMGWQHNLAIQLFNPSATTGNWMAPYCGVVPRLGLNLGKARLDVGALVGLGVMGRTVGQVGSTMSYLDTRFQWVVEPRVEVGMMEEHRGVSVVAAYLLTPNPQDMGGISIGLKGTFGGGGHGW